MHSDIFFNALLVLFDLHCFVLTNRNSLHVSFSLLIMWSNTHPGTTNFTVLCSSGRSFQKSLKSNPDDVIINVKKAVGPKIWNYIYIHICVLWKLYIYTHYFQRINSCKCSNFKITPPQCQRSNAHKCEKVVPIVCKMAIFKVHLLCFVNYVMHCGLVWIVLSHQITQWRHVRAVFRVVTNGKSESRGRKNCDVQTLIETLLSLEDNDSTCVRCILMGTAPPIYFSFLPAGWSVEACGQWAASFPSRARWQI